jgi:hypothetical protein
MVVGEDDGSAMEALNQLRRDNLLLAYVLPMITRIETSEEVHPYRNVRGSAEKTGGSATDGTQ